MNTTVPESLVTTSESQVRRKSPNWESFYANHFNLALGLDFKLNFGRNSDETEDEKSVVYEEKEIIMTKELAKILWVLLGQHLSSYEELYGEIVLPGLARQNESEKATPAEKKKIK